MQANTLPPASPRKLRVLCLHSFRTSALIFKQQFARAKLDVQLDDMLDMVFIDAPHPASGKIPQDVAPYFKPPFYEWFTATDMGDKVEFDEEKVARTTLYVETVLREQGPFDGIVGFSQGAVLAAALVAMQQRGEVLQDVAPLKFCILFAGLKSRHPRHRACMPPATAKLPVPSLHIFGDKDELREHCIELANVFADAIVLAHTRGHRIPPLNPQLLAVVRAFLGAFQPGGIANPGGIATPAPIKSNL